VRLLVSNLSDFRRATSRIANFIIVVSLLLLPVTMLLPRQRFWGSVVVLLYLVLALVLRVTIRRTEVDSLVAVRIIEVAFLAAVLVEGIWRAYYAWQNPSVAVLDSFDIAMQFLIGLVLWKNISIAKSLALKVQNLDNSNSGGATRDVVSRVPPVVCERDSSID
jgi:hypothetical protein